MWNNAISITFFLAIDVAYIDTNRHVWLFQATIAANPWKDHRPDDIFSAVPASCQKEWLESTKVSSVFTYYATGEDAKVTAGEVAQKNINYVLLSSLAKDVVSLPWQSWAWVATKEDLQELIKFHS
ncbi:MAG: hypothetical protein ACYCUI_16605 [Vulcanimicrobiaceae bacterium]